jgi:hypothetical protein
MKYDVFISYSRTDVAWAKHLQEGLKGRGIHAFRDEDRMTAGDKWDQQLQDAISESRHLLVLWSPHARESDWVEEERIHFQADRKGSAEKRRVIFINLDGKYKSASAFEQVDNINQAGLYKNAQGALDPDPQVWKKVFDKVEEAVKQDASLPIFKVLLVSTLKTLQETPLKAKAGLAPTFGETLEAIGIKSDDTDAWQGELAKYYGPERSRWRPFGAASTIDELLDDMRDRIQGVKGAPAFRWRDVEEEFWSDDADVLDVAVSNIAHHMSFVVIDPLSLYDPQVSSRLPTLRAMLQPQRCATAVLAPFVMPAASSHLRRVVKGAAVELFRQYYEPAFNGSTLYPLSVCAHDGLDLRRVLSASLDAELLQQAQRESSRLPRLG